MNARKQCTGAFDELPRLIGIRAGEVCSAAVRAIRSSAFDDRKARCSGLILFQFAAVKILRILVRILRLMLRTVRSG